MNTITELSKLTFVRSVSSSARHQDLVLGDAPLPETYEVSEISPAEEATTATTDAVRNAYADAAAGRVRLIGVPAHAGSSLNPEIRRFHGFASEPAAATPMLVHAVSAARANASAQVEAGRVPAPFIPTVVLVDYEARLDAVLAARGLGSILADAEAAGVKILTV